VTVEGNVPEYPCLVIAVSSDDEEDWEPEETAIMSVDGSYHLENINQGHYYIAVLSSDAPMTYFDAEYDWHDAIIVNVNQDVHNLNIDLNAPSGDGLISIEGIVSSGDREVLPNSSVIISDVSGNLLRFAMTDENGYYVVNNLPNSEINVFSSRLFYSTFEQNLILENDSVFDITIEREFTDSEKETIKPQNKISNFPNPFYANTNSRNNGTNIKFELTENASVKIEIFNILGEKITTILDETFPKGQFQTNWNGLDKRGNSVSTGIYFYKTTINGRPQLNKMTYIK